MTSPGSLGGDERLRLFCALRLPARTLDDLGRWQQTALAGARGVRAVQRDHLHVTLAFLGLRPAGEVGAIATALRGAAARARTPVFAAARYRETHSVGMVVLDDEEERAGALALGLQLELEGLGVYEPERRPWLAHVTVARFRGRPRLSPPVPELGRFSPSDAALYHSVLRSSGAQYEVLESVALGG